jgi:LPXTG-motif cell wall-anchored protein
MPYGMKARVGVVAALLSLSMLAIVGTSGPAGAASTHDVSIVGLTYSPKALTVQAGDTVVWTNTSAIPHTVTADDNSFTSVSLAPGQTFSHTFASAATVPYHCAFHGAAGGFGMAGTIVVQAAPPPTTAPPVTSPVTSPPVTSPAAPVVAPAPAPTTAPPSGTAPATPSTPVAGDATATPLPRTGAKTGGLVLLAAALLVTGALIAFIGRRRSRFDH